MEILILQNSTKICRLCLKENLEDLCELSQNVQELFYELTQSRVNK